MPKKTKRKYVCLFLRTVKGKDGKKVVRLQIYKNYEDAKKVLTDMQRKKVKGLNKKNLHIGLFPVMNPSDWEREALMVSP